MANIFIPGQVYLFPAPLPNLVSFRSIYWLPWKSKSSVTEVDNYQQKNIPVATITYFSQFFPRDYHTVRTPFLLISRTFLCF